MMKETDDDRTFNSLKAQGKASDDVLRLMQPTLQTLYELQTENGFAVDKTTQRLLSQAEQAGIVGDKNKSATDIQIEATHTLTKAVDTLSSILTGQLVDSTKTAASQMVTAFGDAQKGIGGVLSAIPRNIDVDVNVRTSGGKLPSFAQGSGGFQDFGAGTLAMLHGEEAVVRRDQASGFAATHGGGASSAPVVIKVPVVLDGREIAEVTLPQMFAVLKDRGLA